MWSCWHGYDMRSVNGILLHFSICLQRLLNETLSLFIVDGVGLPQPAVVWQPFGAHSSSCVDEWIEANTSIEIYTEYMSHPVLPSSNSASERGP